MKQRDFRNFEAMYHRNGVAGEGFHACSFEWREHGHKWLPMRAVVFEKPGHVAVLTDNPQERWRGDDFEPLLRAAIAVQDEKEPMRAYTFT